MMKKMDKDGNGRLSLEDYKLSVQDDSLLLEALGPCLPDAKVSRLEPSCLHALTALYPERPKVHGSRRGLATGVAHKTGDVELEY